MAKARSEQPGKIKVRIVEIDLEGSDESLQEGLKALTTALSRSAVAPKLPRAPRIEHANGDGVQTAAEGEIEVEGEQVQDEDDEGVERAPKKSSRKPKIVAGKVVPGLKFDDVEPKFADFASQKNPQSDLAKYIVIAYWLKHHKNISALTPDHFYTAYKIMNWQVPKDIAQPTRDLRHHRNGKFSNGTETGTVTINQVGENAVNQMPGS